MIGLYIAFILPIILRLPAGDSVRARRLEPRQALQVDRLDRDPLGRLHLRRLHAPVRATAASRGTRRFDWNLVNYTPVTVGGAFLLFGGWYVLSARKWFKGPVRMGTDEELERIEAESGEGELLRRPTRPPPSAGSAPEPLSGRIEERLGGDLALDPLAEDLDLDRLPGLRRAAAGTYA